MTAERDLSRPSGNDRMTADSAKHAEMDRMKQTTQRFRDLWFSGKTDGRSTKCSPASGRALRQAAAEGRMAAAA